jgi:NAD+ kinase
MFDTGKLLQVINDEFDDNKYIKHYENVVIAKGGDGTLLKAIKHFGHLDIPFWGINAGTVGFLMNDKHLSYADKRRIKTVEFSRIKVQVTYTKSIRDMASIGDKDIEVTDTFQAFNDIMIGGDMNSWITFDVTEKDEIFANFKGGGLIISSPQGSTGINKNNGGVVLPLSSNLWSITGDKTDRHIEYVIKPRKMTVNVKSRYDITLWVDGSNEVIKRVKSIVVTKGSKIKVMFGNYEEFKIKRRV